MTLIRPGLYCSGLHGLIYVSGLLVKPALHGWQENPRFISRSLDPHSLGLKWLSSQVLTSFARALFITFSLKRRFLEGCRQGSNNFWNPWACIGYGPRPVPTLKFGTFGLLERLHISQNTRLKPYNQMNFNILFRILNYFICCYQTLIILFDIINSFVHNEMVSSIVM